MANHLIVYGHGGIDPGAIGNGTNERDFNRKILHPYIKKWTDKSKDNFTFYDVSGNKNLYAETANGWGLYSMTSKSYASITELHEDAAASSAATGGHTIVNSSFLADKFDLSLASIINKIVGWWGSVKNTKGISYRNNLLNCNVAANRGINYRLMELGFITNSSDMSKIRNNLDTYAKGIVEGITGETLSDTVTNTPSTPSTPKTAFKVGDKVKVKIALYKDKDGNGRSTKSAGKTGTIKRDVKTGKRYLIDNLGWAHENDIQLISRVATSKPSTPASNTPAKPTPTPVAPKPVAPTKPKMLSATAIRDEVIAGKWGSGQDRISRLTKAGYDAKKVQDDVNKKLLGGTTTASKKKTNQEVAKEIYLGEGGWGNGTTRTTKLKAAGYDPVIIQNLVNKMF